MSQLRLAARAALEQRYAGGTGPSGTVERMSIDLRVGPSRELVSLALRGTELSWSCSCGERECSHAHAALAILAGEGEVPVPVARELEESARAASADRRTVAYAEQAAGGNPSELAGILRDLITAVVRSGLGSEVSASLEEVLQRLVGAAPSPLPLGVSRFVGRLKKAIAERDEDVVARLLHGASQLADDLECEQVSEQGRARVLSWLGALRHDAVGIARMTDLSLLEIAREWLPGIERSGVERRYMIDLGTGQVYREEREPSAKNASLGPCPRQLTELLALVEQCAPPKRVRLLQYAVTPAISAEAWEQVSLWAITDFELLAAPYREALGAFPGLAEPFVMVRPDGLAPEAQTALRDAGGHVLPVQGPDRFALCRCLRAVSEGAELLWVAGRLTDQGGAIGIVPLSAAVRRHGRISYAQM